MLGSTVRRRALSSCAAGLAGRRGPEEIGATPPGGEVDVADIERDGGEPSGLEGRGGGAVALDAGDLSQDSAIEAEGCASGSGEGFAGGRGRSPGAASVPTRSPRLSPSGPVEVISPGRGSGMPMDDVSATAVPHGEA